MFNKWKYRKKINHECDSDFWGILYYGDVEEVQENNVRYCFTIYEPVN